MKKIRLFHIYQFCLACLAIGSIVAPCLFYQNDFFNVVSLIGFFGFTFLLNLNSGVIRKEKKKQDVPKKKSKIYIVFIGISIFLGTLWAIANALLSVSYLFFKDFTKVPFPYSHIPQLALIIIFGILVYVGPFIGKKYFEET